MIGRIYQINKKAETLDECGLPKHPAGLAKVTFAGLEGDFNRYRHEKRKDTLEQALLVMPIEMIRKLNEEGWPVQPGDFGENITSEGIPYDSMTPGKLYKIGSAAIRISKACTPCTNLYKLPYVGKIKGPQFLKTVLNRRGWYASVIEEGIINVGDRIEEI